MHTFIAHIEPPTPRAPSPSEEASLSPDELPPLAAFGSLADRVNAMRHGSHVRTAPLPQIMIVPDDDDEPSSPNGVLTQQPEPYPVFDVASSLTRILYFHANLHPDRLYNQAWPALLSPIYYVVASSGAETGDPYQAEADAFWTFGELLGDVDPVLGIIDKDGANRGVQNLLDQLSIRVKWADEEFWQVLVGQNLCDEIENKRSICLSQHRKSLDPALPYWSFRWMSCMISQTLPLHHTIQIWDLLLAQPPAQSSNNETPRLSFLVDICASMLLRLRPRLVVAGNHYKGGLWGDVEVEEDQTLTEGTMGDGFVEGMRLVQHYPIEAIGVSSIIQGAWYLVDREKRGKEVAIEQAKRAAASVNSTYSLSRVTDSLRGFGWGGGGVARSFSKGSDPAGPFSPDATPREKERPASKSLRYGYFDIGDAAARISKARSNLTAAAIAWSSSPDPSPTAAATFDMRTWVSGSSTPRSSVSGESASRHARTTSATSDISLHHPASPPVRDRSRLPMLDPAFSPPESPRISERSRSPPLVRATSPPPFLRARSPPLGEPQTPSSPNPTTRIGGGVRPLILSNRRVTRDSGALSRHSSLSSRASDTEGTSRIIPLRRRRVVPSPSPGSPPSSDASSIKSPKSRFDRPPLGPEDIPQEHDRRTTIIAVTSPSSGTTIPGLPTPGESLEDETIWREPEKIGVPKRGATMPVNEDSSLAVHSSPSLQRQSRLRAKRSIPLLDSMTTRAMTMPLTPDDTDNYGTDRTSIIYMQPPELGADRASHSPLTPRPPLGQMPDTNVPARRPSPKPRRTRKTSHRKEEKPLVPLPEQMVKLQSEVAYIPSEEEGVKGDDEDDYNDLISSYSTDADVV